MSVHLTTDLEPVTVWLEQERPARVVWRGTRYRVTDRPTPITDSVPADYLTHPASRLAGWRFQGTSESGGRDVDVRMFDVIRQAAGRWVLAATYS